LKAIVKEYKPEVVFHLAAQPLVRDSYKDPVGTYTTNVIGTVNVLESVRECDSVRAVVVITTDKCYENEEWVWPYRETDRLGGYDPYSNSKACAELVVSAYRNSFFPPAHYDQHRVAIASARAGNVIGGGDWAEFRIVPDFFRSLKNRTDLVIRFPNATRPWQHVLEPISGYLLLASKLYSEGKKFQGGWNFGPLDEASFPVIELIEQIRNYTRKVIKGTAFIVLPIIIAAALLYPPYIYIFMKEPSYIQSLPVFYILLLGIILPAIYNFSGGYFAMANFLNTSLLTMIQRIIFNVISAIICINIFGFWGAAISTSLTYILSMVLLYYYLKKKMDIDLLSFR